MREAVKTLGGFHLGWSLSRAVMIGKGQEFGQVREARASRMGRCAGQWVVRQERPQPLGCWETSVIHMQEEHWSVGMLRCWIDVAY
jgi:hypothetical protein